MRVAGDCATASTTSTSPSGATRVPGTVPVTTSTLVGVASSRCAHRRGPPGAGNGEKPSGAGALQEGSYTIRRPLARTWSSTSATSPASDGRLLPGEKPSRASAETATTGAALPATSRRKECSGAANAAPVLKAVTAPDGRTKVPASATRP